MFDLESANSDTILPIMLFTLSAVFLTLYFVIVTYRLFQSKGVSDDEWRDPAPFIFKIFRPIVRLFSADVKANMDEDNYIQMQLKLSSAGLFYSLLPEEFVTLRYVCMGVTCLIAGGVYWQYAPLSYNIIALLVLAVFLGYAYPDIWLKDRIKARHIKIEREFPFLLDLLILSMKAGLNYSNALSQSIDSLKSGPIKEDFGRMQRELKAGKPRKDALVEMAERMDSPAIHNFVSSLNQAEETGGEMVVVLQGQAEHRRSERFQAAEEMAGKAPVKMLVPMMVFLFPLIFMLVGWVIMVGMAEADVLSPSLMRLMGY